MLRLPWEVAPLFKEWLALHYPDRAERVMARIADMRGGKEYDANFATRMIGSVLWADLIKQRFQKAVQRYDLIPPVRASLNFDCTRFDASVFSNQTRLF